MEHRHHFIIYSLLALLAIWLLYTTISFSTYKEDQDTWVCSNIICTRMITGEDWAQQNCFLAPTDNGSQAAVCRVVIDGVNQLVPLNALNLSGIQQCVEYACNQEVNARPANYALNLSQLTTG